MKDQADSSPLESIEALFEQRLPDRPLEGLEIELRPYIDEVINHSIFEKISKLSELTALLEHQLYCSWDFMNLLKSFEMQMGCTIVPWIPSSDPLITSWINKRILDEESLELAPGIFSSHFELLKSACEDVGADTLGLSQVLNDLMNGNKLDSSLPLFNLQRSTKDYLSHGSRISECSPHEIFSLIVIARDRLFQKIAGRLLDRLDEIDSRNVNRLRLYLEIHCASNPEQQQIESLIFQKLCSNSERAWSNAYDAAFAGIKLRKSIYDELADNLRFKTV